ncbi:unnamed protein product, partial [marine sediment metagenome]
QNRRDIDIKARRGGDIETAGVFTGLIKHAFDEMDGDAKASDCFHRGNKTGKGWLFIDIDADSDPINKEFSLESVSTFNVEEDPNGKSYDMNDDHQFVTLKKWEDKQKIEKKYPKHKEEMDSFNMSGERGWVGKLVDGMYNFFVGGNQGVKGAGMEVDEE